MKYVVTNNKEAVQKHQKLLGSEIWPEFMRHDEIAEKYWPTLYERFSEFQFAVFDNNKIVGLENMIPLNWNKPFNLLPDRGVDWALEKANSDFSDHIVPNLLVAMQILIAKEYQGKGISAEMVKIMLKIAKQHHIDNIALPVRPTLKHKYPLLPMKEYVKWKREDGKAFDSWIRVHLNLGGKIVGICNRSMEISGTVKQWEDWSGLDLQSSGDYVINDALVPVNIDVKNNTGTYIEPNVWIIHSH